MPASHCTVRSKLRLFSPLIILLLLAAVTATSADYSRDTRAYNIAHGRVVFESQCLTCHASGQRGAPVFGNIDEWRDRVGQPLDQMIGHAIHGHDRMPPKGGTNLSDQDVAAAVAFVVDRMRTLSGTNPDPDRDLEVNELPPTAAGGATEQQDDGATDSSVIQMFMLLYGKDRWK